MEVRGKASRGYHGPAMTRRAFAGLAAAGLGLTVHALRYDFVADDTFIFLRYARNLLDGQGLVYNPGEHVEGYSSLLFTLLVAAAGRLGLDLLTAARALSLLAALATLPAAVGLARRLGVEPPALAAFPALALAAQAPFACWALAGMDATLYALGATVGLLLVTVPLERGTSRVLAGSLLGSLLLVRPEAWLVAGVVLVALGKRDGPRRLVAVAGPCGAIATAQLLWRHAYYGDWLPNTYYAKVGQDFDQIGRGLAYLLDYAQAFGAGPLLLLPFLAALWRRDLPWRATAATAVLMPLGVAWVGGDGLPMYRFLVPVVPLWAVLWTCLVSDAWRAARTLPSLTPARAALTASAVAVLVAAAGLRPAPNDPQHVAMRDQRDREVPDWTEVGRFLRGYARPGDSVALAPIGAVGYYSGLPVVDMLGLVDRHIARRVMPPAARRWAGHEKHDGAYVLDRAPTFLLLGNVRVLPVALPPDNPQFIRPANPWIEAREGDMYADAERLQRDYGPRVVRLPSGRYLHFLERRRPGS
jgi:arabinofuranosyltransferase